MRDIMASMEQVNERGLRTRQPVQEQKEERSNGLVNNKNSITNHMLAYEKMMKNEQVAMKEQREEKLRDLILEDKDKVRIIGALQVIRESVNRDFTKDDPAKILMAIKKIVDTFRE